MPLTVAIVGSGPAGFYTAAALKKGCGSCKIDIIERLPTPFGLIRSGVAPDHQSIKKISKEQPDNFEFSADNLELAKKIINNYPEGKQQSAVMSLLYIAQKQNNNWIPLAAMKYIAKFLKIPYIKVYEVSTFYSMYNLSSSVKYPNEI